MSLNTPDQVRAELKRKGISVAAWAAANKLNSNLVYDLLAGRKKGERGQAHKAAVLLGMKSGEISKAEDVHFATFANDRLQA